MCWRWNDCSATLKTLGSFCFVLFFNRSMRVLVARTAKFLSTKICLYPTQPGEHPRSLSHLGLNGFEETFGKLAPTE